MLFRFYYNINQIQKIVELPQGKMAVGTTYGLVVVDPRSGKQRTVDYTPWGTNVSNRYVLDLMVHRGKELWIATDGGGVYVLDLHTGRPHRITMHNSLPSNGVESLIEDRQGRVWVGTEHGMAFVDGRGQVANVSYCYGLEREYCFKAAALLQNGQIVFGSTSGAVIINPSSIRGNGLNVTLHPQRVVVQDGRPNDDRINIIRFAHRKSTYNTQPIAPLIEEKINQISNNRCRISCFLQRYNIGTTLFNYIGYPL